jgi:hypothetical protein
MKRVRAVQDLDHSYGDAMASTLRNAQDFGFRLRFALKGERTREGPSVRHL